MERDDARRFLQLIEGEVVVNEPGPPHQHLVGEIFSELRAWIRAGDGRGRVSLSLDIKVDERNVYAPDVLWFAPAELAPLRGRPPFPLPSLAVEVRSPSTWRYDVGVKKARYEAEGLRELWLVDGEAQSVLVFRRSRAGAPGFDVAAELAAPEALTSPLLPGFALVLAELFADPA